MVLLAEDEGIHWWEDGTRTANGQSHDWFEPLIFRMKSQPPDGSKSKFSTIVFERPQYTLPLTLAIIDLMHNFWVAS